MRALRVNFAPELAWKRRVFFGVMVLSWVFACTAGWHAWKEWRALQVMDAALLQARVKQAEQLVKERELQAELGKPKPYAADAAEAVRIASFPTDLILRALEATQVEGVRVTSIDLNPDSAVARVELEFTETGQLMKYVELINEGEERARWELIQLKANKSGGQTSSGTAALSSTWRYGSTTAPLERR